MSLKYADVSWLRVPRVTSKTNTAALPESAGRRAQVSHRESGDHFSDKPCSWPCAIQAGL